jgi:hypothetical protein
MRSAASCCHPLQESVVPRAARKGPRDKAPSATVPERVALIKKLRVHLNAAPRPTPQYGVRQLWCRFGYARAGVVHQFPVERLTMTLPRAASADWPRYADKSSALPLCGAPPRSLMEYTLLVKRSMLTRPLLVVPPRVKRFLVVLSISLIVLVVFAPGVLTLVWHLRYGSTILYRDKQIPVPLGWIAKSEPQDVQLDKLALTVLSSDKPVEEMITASLLAPTSGHSHEELSRSFVSVYWTYLAGDSVVTGPLHIGSGSQEALCMESSPPKMPGRVSVVCLMFQDRWVFRFDGDRKDLSEFYRLLGKIR